MSKLNNINRRHSSNGNSASFISWECDNLTRSAPPPPITTCTHEPTCPMSIRKRRRVDIIASLIDSGMYNKVVECVYLSGRGGEQEDKALSEIAQMRLRRIVNEKSRRNARFRQEITANLDNLCYCIESGNDSDSVDLLERGVRFDDSRRSLGVLLELCESRTMPRTVSFLINHRLLPASLGIAYFVASLNSRNAPLMFHLRDLPSVRESLYKLSNSQRTLYRAMYCYIMFKYLMRNALDCIIFERFCEILNVNDFSDEEFLVLVRHGDILTLCSDQQVIELRNQPHFNPFGAASNLAPLACWLNVEMSTAADIAECDLSEEQRKLYENRRAAFVSDLDHLLQSLCPDSPGVRYLKLIFKPAELWLWMCTAA